MKDSIRRKSDNEVSALADAGDAEAQRECKRRNLVEIPTLRCTPCGHEIPEGAKYLAVFKSDHGLLLKVGCEHQPVADVEQAEAVFGSGGCLTWWLGQLLNPCDHEEPS